MSNSSQKSDTSRFFHVFLMKNNKYKYFFFDKPIFTHIQLLLNNTR